MSSPHGVLCTYQFSKIYLLFSVLMYLSMPLEELRRETEFNSTPSLSCFLKSLPYEMTSRKTPQFHWTHLAGRNPFDFIRNGTAINGLTFLNIKDTWLMNWKEASLMDVLNTLSLEFQLHDFSKEQPMSLLLDAVTKLGLRTKDELIYNRNVQLYERLKRRHLNDSLSVHVSTLIYVTIGLKESILLQNFETQLLVILIILVCLAIRSKLDLSEKLHDSKKCDDVKVKKYHLVDYIDCGFRALNVKNSEVITLHFTSPKVYLENRKAFSITELFPSPKRSIFHKLFHGIQSQQFYLYPVSTSIQRQPTVRGSTIEDSTQAANSQFTSSRVGNTPKQPELVFGACSKSLRAKTDDRKPPGEAYNFLNCSLGFPGSQNLQQSSTRVEKEQNFVTRMSDVETDGEDNGAFAKMNSKDSEYKKKSYEPLNDSFDSNLTAHIDYSTVETNKNDNHVVKYDKSGNPICYSYYLNGLINHADNDRTLNGATSDHQQHKAYNGDVEDQQYHLSHGATQFAQQYLLSNGADPAYTRHHSSKRATPFAQQYHLSRGATPFTQQYHLSHGATPFAQQYHLSHGATPLAQQYHLFPGARSFAQQYHSSKKATPFAQQYHLSHGATPFAQQYHLSNGATPFAQQYHLSNGARYFAQQYHTTNGATPATWWNTATTSNTDSTRKKSLKASNRGSTRNRYSKKQNRGSTRNRYSKKQKNLLAKIEDGWVTNNISETKTNKNGENGQTKIKAHTDSLNDGTEFKATKDFNIHPTKFNANIDVQNDPCKANTTEVVQNDLSKANTHEDFRNDPFKANTTEVVQNDLSKANTHKDFQNDPCKANTTEVVQNDLPKANTHEDFRNDPFKANTTEDVQNGFSKANTHEDVRNDPFKANTTKVFQNDPFKANTTEAFQNDPCKGNTTENVQNDPTQTKATEDYQNDPSEANAKEYFPNNITKTKAKEYFPNNTTETEATEYFPNNTPETEVTEYFPNNTTETEATEYFPNNTPETEVTEYFPNNTTETEATEYFPNNTTETEVTEYFQKNTTETEATGYFPNNTPETEVTEYFPNNTTETEVTEYFPNNTIETNGTQDFQNDLCEAHLKEDLRTDLAQTNITKDFENEHTETKASKIDPNYPTDIAKNVSRVNEYIDKETVYSGLPRGNTSAEVVFGSNTLVLDNTDIVIQSNLENYSPVHDITTDADSLTESIVSNCDKQNIEPGNKLRYASSVAGSNGDGVIAGPESHKSLQSAHHIDNSDDSHDLNVLYRVEVDDSSSEVVDFDLLAHPAPDSPCLQESRHSECYSSKALRPDVLPAYVRDRDLLQLIRLCSLLTVKIAVSCKCHSPPCTSKECTSSLGTGWIFDRAAEIDALGAAQKGQGIIYIATSSQLVPSNSEARRCFVEFSSVSHRNFKGRTLRGSSVEHICTLGETKTYLKCVTQDVDFVCKLNMAQEEIQKLSTNLPLTIKKRLTRMAIVIGYPHGHEQALSIGDSTIIKRKLVKDIFEGSQQIWLKNIATCAGEYETVQVLLHTAVTCLGCLGAPIITFEEVPPKENGQSGYSLSTWTHLGVLEASDFGCSAIKACRDEEANLLCIEIPTPPQQIQPQLQEPQQQSQHQQEPQQQHLEQALPSTHPSESSQQQERLQRQNPQPLAPEHQILLQIPLCASPVPGNRAAGNILPSPSYPAFLTLSKRLETFDLWPARSVHTAIDLASNGFFYAGYSDCVRCFQCGLGLRSWKHGDDIVQEHQRFRPGCPFLLSVIRAAESRWGGETLVAPPQEVDTVPPTSQAGACQGTGGNKQQSCPTNDQHQTESSQETVERLSLTTHNHIVTYQNEAIVMFAHRENPVARGDDSDSGYVEDVIFPVDEQLCIQQDDNGETTSVSEASNTSTTVEYNSNNIDASSRAQALTARLLQTENRKLHDLLTCKVCHQNPIKALFLPCGDLYACESCSNDLSHCPHCKKRILGTVTTFFA